MFNFFNKNKKQEKDQEDITNKISITYFIDEDNNAGIDIMLLDYEEDSITALCSLLDILSQDTFYINTVQMIQDNLIEHKEDAIMMKILTHLAKQPNNRIVMHNKQKKESQVCVSPSDIILQW